MPEEYLVGNDENGFRTTSNIGKATLIGGDGKTQSTGTMLENGWAPVAYSAGGGALGYLLSKWILGDDDDKKGKKSGGFLKSLIPWLAAAAGAAGGYYLSGATSRAKGGKGEFAFKKDKDGNVMLPNEAPGKGGTFHRMGNVSAGVSAATGARAALSAAANRPARLSARLSKEVGDLSDMERKLNLLARHGFDDPQLAVDIGTKREIVSRIQKKLTGSAARGDPTLHPVYSRIVGWGGKQAPGKLGRLFNTGGMAATSIGTALLSWLSHAVGSRMNETARKYREGRQALVNQGIIPPGD